MPQNTQCKESKLKTHALPYKERLNTWAVSRILADEQRVIVARFRSLSDADGHMRLMRQLNPNARFELGVDCQREEAN